MSKVVRLARLRLAWKNKVVRAANSGGGHLGLILKHCAMLKTLGLDKSGPTRDVVRLSVY